jgi:hypothetical protein
MFVNLSGGTSTPTVVTLTFGGPLTAFGSLSDGNYTLTVFSTKVIGPGGQPLDGDGNGQPGGDMTLKFYRLFGDTNGDRKADATDLFRMRAAYGQTKTSPDYLAYLDFNGDGAINGLDLAQFRTRFGTTLP